MYSTTLQFTKFQNIVDGEVDKESTQYGYRLYNTDEAVYSNVYNTLEELQDDLDRDSVLDHIKENHPDFYDTIEIDGGFYFNNSLIDLDGDEIDEDDEEKSSDETLLPDNSEMPNGEPKYIINIPEDDIKEVEQIIVEASDNLI